MFNLFKPIPNSLICTKVLLDAYSHLWNELKGECSSQTCPMKEIRFNKRPCYNSYRQNRTELFCSFCDENWDLIDQFCPCRAPGLTKEQVFARLAEVIDQLQNKISHEYSS